MATTSAYASAANSLAGGQGAAPAAVSSFNAIEHGVDLPIPTTALSPVITMWIASQLSFFKKTIKSLVLDSGAVSSWADGCNGIAEKLASQEAELVSTAQRTDWEGEAAEAFRAHISSAAQCLRAAAGTWRSVQSAGLACASDVSEGLRSVMDTSTSLANDLFAGAQEFLQQSGGASPVSAIAFIAKWAPVVAAAAQSVEAVVLRVKASGADAARQFGQATTSLNSATASLGGTPAMQSNDNRPSLDDVLTENQVADDEMVAWTPPFFPANLLMKPRDLTKSEAAMLNDLSLEELGVFSNIHDNAFERANELYPAAPGVDGNDDHNDAFRHAYWSARLAMAFGPDWAEDYTTHHERIPNNPAAREAMDLHNNSIGIQIVRDNPDASKEEIEQLIQEAVENGDTVVIGSDGELEWSDHVEEGQTGEPDENERLPGEDPGPPEDDTDSVPDQGTHPGDGPLLR